MKATATFLVEIRVAGELSLEIQATSVEDEDEELGCTALLGEKGDTQSLTNPDESLRICGGEASMRGGDAWRRTEMGDGIWVGLGLGS